MAGGAWEDSAAVEASALSALAALHSPGTPAEARAEASRWLVALQAQGVAWAVGHGLLTNHAQSTEAALFGAQTLQRKVANQLGTLGRGDWPGLREGLLQHLRAYADRRSSVVVRQLCLALAQLVLRWESWAAPLADCGSALPTHCFQELLQALAEESQRGAGSGSEKAMLWRTRVSSWAPEVLSHLTNVAAAAMSAEASVGAPILERALATFASWARLGCLHDLPWESFGSLLQASFKAALHAGDGSSGWSCTAAVGAAAVADVQEHTAAGLDLMWAGSMAALPQAGLRAARAGEDDVAAAVFHVRPLNSLTGSPSPPPEISGRLLSRAFVQFCGSNPDLLLEGDLADSFREGLLSIAVLPVSDSTNPLAAPALETVGTLLDAVHARKEQAGSHLAGAPEVVGMVTRLMHGLVPNILLTDSQSDTTEEGEALLRPAATEFLAAASRAMGVDACSAYLDQAFEHCRALNGAKEWQLMEANTFAMCACAEGFWGQPVQSEQHEGLARKIEAVVTRYPQAMLGAPAVACRSGYLWLLRWLSATAEPLLRVNSSLGPRWALQLTFNCFQAVLGVMHLSDSSSSSEVDLAGAKLALRCAASASELLAVLRSGGEDVSAELEVLEKIRQQLHHMADSQLCQANLQGQVMLIGAGLVIAKSLGLYEASLLGILEPCQPTVERAAAAAEAGSNTEGADGVPDMARRSVIRLHAAIRSISDTGEGGSGRGAETEKAMSAAVQRFVGCWPVLAPLMLRAGPGYQELATCTCRCAAAAMRADGRAFLPALESVLQCSVQLVTAPGGQDDTTESAAALLRTLAAATEVYGGWNWGGGWAAVAADGAADAEKAQSYVLMALAEINQSHIIVSLEGRGAPDKAPDLAMSACAVGTAFASSCAPVLPRETAAAAAPAVLQAALRLGAACAPCNHKGVALAGLSLSSAVITCGREPSLQEPVANALRVHGGLLMTGVLGTLTGPSPLGKLHKLSCLLVDLMGFLTRACETSEQATEAALRWLSEALASLPDSTLLPGERDAVLQEWQPLLLAAAMASSTQNDNSSGPSTGEYSGGQSGSRLKRAMRVFASRHAAGHPCQ